MRYFIYASTFFLILCSSIDSSAQNLCDRLPQLLGLLNEKNFHKIIGSGYMGIFADSREYRPAVRFEGMIDERISSSVRVFPTEVDRSPVLQYSFRVNGRVVSELTELEKLRDRLLDCGLSSWVANTQTDVEIGKSGIYLSNPRYDETIYLTLEKAFLDGFTRTDVYVLQIVLNGWQ